MNNQIANINDENSVIINQPQLLKNDPNFIYDNIIDSTVPAGTRATSTTGFDPRYLVDGNTLNKDKNWEPYTGSGAFQIIFSNYIRLKGIYFQANLKYNADDVKVEIYKLKQDGSWTLINFSTIELIKNSMITDLLTIDDDYYNELQFRIYGDPTNRIQIQEVLIHRS